VHRANNAFLAILDEVNRQLPEDNKFRPSHPHQIGVSSLRVPVVLRAHRELCPGSLKRKQMWRLVAGYFVCFLGSFVLFFFLSE